MVWGFSGLWWGQRYDSDWPVRPLALQQMRPENKLVFEQAQAPLYPVHGLESPRFHNRSVLSTRLPTCAVTVEPGARSLAKMTGQLLQGASYLCIPVLGLWILTTVPSFCMDAGI